MFDVECVFQHKSKSKRYTYLVVAEDDEGIFIVFCNGKIARLTKLFMKRCNLSFRQVK